MIKSLVFAFLSLMILNEGLAFQPKEMAWSKDGYYSAEVPEGFIYVEVQSPTVYKLKGSESVFGIFANVYRLEAANSINYENLKKSLVKDGYFTLNGSVIRVGYGKTAKIDVPDTLDGPFGFTESGKCQIPLTVGKSGLFIPIDVVELPLRKGDPAAALVEAFGEPASKEEFIISWPRSEVRDTILYKPEPGKGPIIASHWRFKSMPNLVVSIVDSKIFDVGSVSKSNLARLRLLDIDAKTKAAEAELKTKIEADRAEMAARNREEQDLQRLNSQLAQSISLLLWGNEPKPRFSRLSQPQLKRIRNEVEKIEKSITVAKINDSLNEPYTCDIKKRKFEFRDEKTRSIALDRLTELTADVPK